MMSFFPPIIVLVFIEIRSQRNSSIMLSSSMRKPSSSLMILLFFPLMLFLFFLRTVSSFGTQLFLNTSPLVSREVLILPSSSSQSTFHTRCKNKQQEVRIIPKTAGRRPCNYNHQLRMVRNIDLVEALIFYGRESIFMIGDDNDMEEDKKENNKPHDSFQMLLLPGVENLIEECKRDETAVLVILEDIQEGSLSPSAILGNYVTIRTERGRPPNPKDLWDAIHSIEINPRGFGGSSGFGRKAADPRRSPLPKHCVVLCHTVDQCRAARYAGMRVLCLADNALADAIIDDGGSWESIGMDDIATPGSFWLNPPHPKDDEGNAVDPVSIIQAYYDQQEKDDPSMINQAAKQLKRDRPSSSSSAGDDIEEDEYLAAILADIDPL